MSVDPEKLDGAPQDDDCRERVVQEAEQALADRGNWIKLQREWFTVRYGMRAKKKLEITMLVSEAAPTPSHRSPSSTTTR